MDACVLIDFIKADRGVLKLISDYVGSLHVLSAVLDEVKEIKDLKELSELHLIVIEPELEDAFTASGDIGSISFQDKLCLLTAERHGFICVTNDKEVRKQCEKNNVELLWGLQLIARLHKSGGIKAEQSVKLAWTIHRNNPNHINEEIVKRFIDIIEKQK
jgi:predicted nucleic acid-binding protein